MIASLFDTHPPMQIERAAHTGNGGAAHLEKENRRLRMIMRRLNLDPEVASLPIPELEGALETALERIADERKRTKADVLFQLPITVSLGGTEYQVKPLTARNDLMWRKQFAGFMTALMGHFGGDASAVGASITPWLLTDGYDLMTGLLFSYSPELAAAQDTILDNSQSIELANATVAVLETFAFPFFQALSEGVGKLGR